MSHVLIIISIVIISIGSCCSFKGVSKLVKLNKLDRKYQKVLIQYFYLHVLKLYPRKCYIDTMRNSSCPETIEFITEDLITIILTLKLLINFLNEIKD
jgi:hypothetical protein